MGRYAEPWMDPKARQVNLCESCGREADPETGRIRHVATVEQPSLEDLEEQSSDGIVETTDGCMVEPDGHCEHGHQSWLLRLGYI